MEGSDGNAVVEKRRGGAAEGEGQDMDAVVDGHVKGGQDVGVEALVAGDGGPADLVGSDAGLRGATFGCSEPLAEDADAMHRVAGGGGEGVGAMALRVTW